MVSNMKTTVELPDALLAEARALAASSGLTLRELIEEGLRHSLQKRKTRKRFRLEDGSFGSGPMRPEFADAPWEKIRDAIYGWEASPDSR